MFQTCPICQGNGYFYQVGYSDTSKCPTCNGKRIINDVTGKPPEDNLADKQKDAILNQSGE